MSVTENMQKVVKQLVEEKYDLIDEINRLQMIKIHCDEEWEVERDFHMKEIDEFLTEISVSKFELRSKMENIDGLITENNELKKGLFEANKTIERLGLMFLKMKSTKDTIQLEQ